MNSSTFFAPEGPNAAWRPGDEPRPGVQEASCRHGRSTRSAPPTARNRNQANAFGKCVSSMARMKNDAARAAAVLRIDDCRGALHHEGDLRPRQEDAARRRRQGSRQGRRGTARRRASRRSWSSACEAPSEPERVSDDGRGPSGPLRTERAGFEPATQLSPRTRFPVALLRPLGHLSESEKSRGSLPREGAALALRACPRLLSCIP